MSATNIRTTLERWLRLDRFPDRTLAAVVFGVEGINTLVTALMAAVFLVSGSPEAANAVASFLLTLGLVALTWLGYLTLVCWVLPGLMLVMTTIGMLSGPGLSSLAVFVLPAIIIVAGLFLRRRGVVTFTLLSMAAVLVTGAVRINQGDTPVENISLGMGVLPVLLALVGGITFLLITILNRSVRRVQLDEQALLEANQSLQAAQASLERQVAEGARSAAQSQQSAEEANRALQAQVRQAVGQAELNDRMRGEQDVSGLARAVINHLCRHLEAPIGALYLLDDGVLRLAGSYAYSRRKQLSHQFKPGEGLVGQAALEEQMLIIDHLPEDYMAVTSGLGRSLPRALVAAPFLFEGRVIGVVELGLHAELAEAQRAFLEGALENIAIAFNTAQARARIDQLLAETRRQATELKAQQEELRATNEELETQADNLRASQDRLRAQQAQLEATNAELEEKASALQEKQSVLDEQNRELRVAREALERKAEELAQANRYKSEFLANMSHELRTPLNSLLILARMLAANESGNLTADQMESAQIIYNSGSDLLRLINDILDLSKVEAGKMVFHFAPMPLEQLADSMRAQFSHVAQDKGLSFEITLADGLPPSIETDQQRVAQVVKNLLANAFKFTERGEVRLAFERPAPGADLGRSDLRHEHAVAIRVADTGIGMTPEQQRIVFEAFQQADGSTARRFGGTGLGLAISRELVMRLGGQISLQSEPGRGSIFTLILPETAPAAASEPAPTRPQPAAAETAVPLAVPAVAAPIIPDDRDVLEEGDKVLLVIEDDAAFARVLYRHARDKGFKCLIAGDGPSGLALVERYRPDAIMLDLNLPGVSGWRVLDAIKQNPDTRHIPVHIVSAASEDVNAYRHGAIGFLTKPPTPEGLDGVFQRLEQVISGQVKSLLLVEDDPAARHSVKKLLEGSDVTIFEAGTARAALELLRTQRFDCMILDLSLPDMNGFALLDRMNADEAVAKCPIIIYTGRALSEEENVELMKYADSVIIKGIKSPERLLDETALFLHRVVAELPEDKRRTIRQLHGGEAQLADKHILVVDDDMRNAFALSRLLGEKGVKVSIARDGLKALDFLEATPGVDLVLMDIMMPGLDGYETMRRVRAQPRFRNLPILALTAKAMKGDEEKCIAAGANDYLSKPVDVDRLFSMLRVWLYR